MLYIGQAVFYHSGDQTVYKEHVGKIEGRSIYVIDVVKRHKYGICHAENSKTNINNLHLQ